MKLFVFVLLSVLAATQAVLVPQFDSAGNFHSSVVPQANQNNITDAQPKIRSRYCCGDAESKSLTCVTTFDFQLLYAPEYLNGDAPSDGRHCHGMGGQPRGGADDPPPGAPRRHQRPRIARCQKTSRGDRVGGLYAEASNFKINDTIHSRDESSLNERLDVTLSSCSKAPVSRTLRSSSTNAELELDTGFTHACARARARDGFRCGPRRRPVSPRALQAPVRRTGLDTGLRSVAQNK
ncbi:hypothetical protein FB451DRAFT_1431173 [Mycena latifolia]|nr:hypothetical protein FB451DRAFT_1431173 [Mycena latifolia]